MTKTNYNIDIHAGGRFEDSVWGQNPQIYQYGDKSKSMWNPWNAKNVIMQQRLYKLEDTLPTVP